MSKTFEAYSIGIMTASVCSGYTPKGTARLMNRRHPTGISSRWTLAADPTFADGSPNPRPCDRDPSKTHYLFHC